MRILGIDPGLSHLGYGIIDVTPNKKNMIECGLIRTNKSNSEGNRLVEIAQDLQTLVQTWHPQLASVEQFFFYRSSNTISIMQVRGVILLILASSKIPVVEFSPRQVKLTLTGFGHAHKKEVLQSIMIELGLKVPPQPDDAADALAIALTGWFHR
ncbi:MAG TPA: crossover junction endodeoxyribonuclease RuvC [Prochlorococcaceae cyanobacterium AMR_MDS_5431]|nr:crossover junction endodeoxyribonuclease RuvC [Prochlorococcaceae cyanobacterium AMR_MDS_5431]